MNKKIFRSSFLTVFLVLIATIVLIMGILFQFFEEQLLNELKSEADYLSQAVENEGTDFFREFKSQNHHRVTLVDADGSVLYDSEANSQTLDNHGNREEIKEALETGEGMSIRYSDTLTQKTVYYAVKLSDQKILRVSTEQYTIVTILLGIAQPMIVILAIALVLTLFLSSRVSKAIIEPINKLDLEAPENNDTYEELTPLLRKIAKQNETIDEQLETARKKQREFNLITENMSEGFLVIDQDAQLLTYNSAALKLLDIIPPVSGSVLTLCRTKEFREAVDGALSGTRSEGVMVRSEQYYSLIALIQIFSAYARQTFSRFNKAFCRLSSGASR